MHNVVHIVRKPFPTQPLTHMYGTSLLGSNNGLFTANQINLFSTKLSGLVQHNTIRPLRQVPLLDRTGQTGPTGLTVAVEAWWAGEGQPGPAAEDGLLPVAEI